MSLTPIEQPAPPSPQVSANVLLRRHYDRTKRIPLRDFFRNPEQSGFQVSPDGNNSRSCSPTEPHERLRAAARGRSGGARHQRDRARCRRLLLEGSPPHRVLKDFKGDENYHLVSVDADGANLVDLTPFDKVRAEIIDDRHDHDDEMIIA